MSITEDWRQCTAVRMEAGYRFLCGRSEHGNSPHDWYAADPAVPAEPEQPAVDMVAHPPHYRHPSGVECITVTEHMTFLRGNAVKYLWRAGSKGGQEQELEDLKKAAWYLAREISNLEQRGANGG